MLTAEVISIGDEILIGDIVDTNSNYIARKLYEISCKLNFVSQIHDNEIDITEAVKKAIGRSDVVIVTGGLGPTGDDITKEVLAKIFDSKLEFRTDIFDDITRFFQKRDIYMPENNKEQAVFPHNATVIKNNSGTAPGIHYEIAQNKHLFSLPGVPYEMEQMMVNYILPLLVKSNDFFIRNLDLHTAGIGESHIFSLLDVEQLQKIGKLAFLPKAAGVLIRLTCEGRDLAQIENSLDEGRRLLESVLSEYITGYNNSSPALNLLNILKKKKFKVSFAESCTGGLIASTLTDISGASEVFKESYVTYANESKYRILAVNPYTLEFNGAVSKETVSEMLMGLIAETNSDIVGAVSGIAGPGGGSEDKPVGTVYIGSRIRGGEEIIERYNFHGNRKMIKERTVNAIFYQMIKLLDDKKTN